MIIKWNIFPYSKVAHDIIIFTIFIVFRAMLISRELLTLLLIGLSSFDLIEGSREDISRDDCNVALNLGAVGLKYLTNGFVKNKFITEIVLDDNEIATVSTDAFSFVPNLSHLSLANNKLKNITLTPFSELNYLKTLILNGNCKTQTETKYRSRPRDDYDYDTYDEASSQESYQEIIYCSLQLDSRLPSLTHLHVENNDIKFITSFPDPAFGGLDNLPMLTHLFLSYNPVNLNRDALLDLSTYAPALTHLYLRHCDIAYFEASLMPTVTSLHLDGNTIRSICSNSDIFHCFRGSLNLTEARNLTELSLSHNRISYIDPNAFSFTKSLLSLDLSNNDISELREGTFDGLHSLHYLSLESNKLVSLSAKDAFRGLIQLEVLYLGGNDLSDIGSDFFTNLTTLRELMLNDTKISGIDSEMFSNLTNLEVLSLASNQLTQIPQEFTPDSDSLTTLNLDDNQFTNTKDIRIVNEPNLLSVSLKNNPLAIISAKWMTKIGSENLTISLGN